MFFLNTEFKWNTQVFLNCIVISFSRWTENNEKMLIIIFNRFLIAIQKSKIAAVEIKWRCVELQQNDSLYAGIYLNPVCKLSFYIFNVSMQKTCSINMSTCSMNMCLCETSLCWHTRNIWSEFGNFYKIIKCRPLMNSNILDAANLCRHVAY